MSVLVLLLSCRPRLFFWVDPSCTPLKMFYRVSPRFSLADRPDTVSEGGSPIASGDDSFVLSLSHFRPSVSQ